MAMEYYDSINATDHYIYFLNKNKKLLTDEDVVKSLEKISMQDESIKSVLFEDKNNFKINEQVINEQEILELDGNFGSLDGKSTRSVSVYNKKNENVIYLLLKLKLIFIDLMIYIAKIERTSRGVSQTLYEDFRRKAAFT